MSIRIITDSASDIGQNELENVIVLPFTVTIGDKSYKDGIDIDKDEFYGLLESSEVMPVSSLISPYEYSQVFDEITEAGDEAILLSLSSELSGTFQSALAAAEDYDNISVIDTMLVTAGQKILVERALQLVDMGLEREEIVKRLEEEKNNVNIFASVDTLKYLLKGGRISKASAVVGGLIDIKPILTLDAGKLISIGKARGSKQSHIFLNKKVQEVGGIDFSMPYAVGYSGTDMTNLQKYIENNHSLLDDAPHDPQIVQIGSAVGTHAGPGAVLVTFFGKNTPNQ